MARLGSSSAKSRAPDAKRRKKKQEWTREDIEQEDEILLSSDEEEEAKRKHKVREETQIREDALEKRNRLARELLGKLEAETQKKKKRAELEAAEDEESAEEEDRVDQALRQEVLRAEGRLVRPIAGDLYERLQTVAVQRSKYRSSHSQSVTSVCISLDETTCFSGSKDGALVGWDVETNQPKWRPAKPENSQVLSIACSSDGTYLASCGDKKGSTIRIWDLRENSPKEPVRTLSGHRDVVTQLAFRHGTHVLLSASDDRSVRLWNVAEGSFIENLFGHQSRICGLDCMARERCVTSAEDLTVRLWKIPEESHLLLSGKHSGAIDCVKMLNESTFVSGSQDGNLALWNVSKRRPLCIVTDAHGPGHWVESVAALHNSDVIASGSHDGMIRLWEVNTDKFKINPHPLATLPCDGHVNSLAFGQTTGSILVAGVGREPRLGRWRCLSDAKNGVQIFRLPHIEHNDM